MGNRGERALKDKPAQAELERGLRRNGKGNGVDHGQTVRETLERFFYRETKSRPVILPNVVEVQ